MTTFFVLVNIAPKEDAYRGSRCCLPHVPSAGEDDDPRALIEEARRLRRRRQMIVLSALLLVAISAAAVGYGASGRVGNASKSGNGNLNANNALLGRAVVKSVNLSTGDKYSSIAVIGDRIVLFGANASNDASMCNFASVDPSSLALSNLEAGNCDNPALAGETVLPVETVMPAQMFRFNGSGGVASVSIRISRVTSKAPGFALGPIVMTFPQESEGRPSWVYGDGFLWLYDGTTTNGSELLRVSEANGTLLQRVSMPDLARPILAVDNDGLWMAPALNTPTPDSGSVLYRVGIGSTKAVAVFPLPGQVTVPWMTAAGHSVWMDVNNDGPKGMIWRFDGQQANVTYHVATNELQNATETQDGPSAIAGDASDGLWTSVSSAGTKQLIYRIDPSSGALSKIATITPGYANLFELEFGFSWKAVTLDGSMFLLDPPIDIGTYPYHSKGFSALYRNTPSDDR